MAGQVLRIPLIRKQEVSQVSHRDLSSDKPVLSQVSRVNMGNQGMISQVHPARPKISRSRGSILSQVMIRVAGRGNLHKAVSGNQNKEINIIRAISTDSQNSPDRVGSMVNGDHPSKVSKASMGKAAAITSPDRTGVRITDNITREINGIREEISIRGIGIHCVMTSLTR